MELIEKIKRAVLSLGEKLDESEAIGICGSLARGNFTEKSDIDLFVIVKDEVKDKEVLWWKRLNEALKEFKRDITVIVYTVSGLKRIATWYVLRLASEGILIYDKGKIKELFEKIVKTAKDAGLVEVKVGNQNVWTAPKLKLGEKLRLEVKD